MQTYSLYFKCPTTKQMQCPVNAYLFAKAEMVEDVIQHFVSNAISCDFS
jgi:hypothetical protein